MNFKQAILSNMDDSDISRIYESESTIIKYNDDDSQVNDIKAANNNNNNVKKQNMKSYKGTSFRSKKPNKPVNKYLMEALESARNIFIKDCIPSKDVIDEILIMTSYIKKWDGKTIPIDLTNDDIIITPQDPKGREYKFSKRRFLKDRMFKNILIKKYKTFLPNVYLRFFPSKKDENIFFIKIS